MVIQTTRSSSNLSAPPRNLPSRANGLRRSRNPVRTAPALDLSTLKTNYDPACEVPKTKRPMGLQEAPTFWPNDKEWADPLGYIASIAEEGKKYGIVKIIPPKEWLPEFSVDTRRFFFRTRKQELNSMEGATRSSMSYIDKLEKFHRQQGTPLTRIPRLNGESIDLYGLKRAVDSRGGFRAACDDKKWADISRELGYATMKNIAGASTTLKSAYQRYLLPYEMYLEKAKPEFLREMGLTPSPQQERTVKSTNSTPISMRRNLMEMMPKSDDTADKAKDEMYVDKVKVESPAPMDSDMNDATPSPSRNGLKRSFDQASARSPSVEDEKTPEPARRESKPMAPMVAGSNMAQHAHAVKPSRMGSMVGRSPSKKPGENCEICGRGDNALNMLLCDGCDTGYHTFCLNPPLKSIPKYDWYCAECLVGTNEFGFEDGEEYSLSNFREKADSFRDEYIRKNMSAELRDVTEEQIEEEFWRMVSNVHETVEVEYGADVHSTTHGSGFPTIETHPTDQYATDPWNLNILPLDNQSLFRHIKSDVSGMTVPWLYVGMMFSTFCWHNEDHYCYSINYQHFGATKTWYGIPGSDAEKFEATMRNAVPELFETQPDLLFQLVTMLSPGRLVEEGVKVYAVDQRPNQFVITFPQAYHAGFNHGFNMNEAVNFAPSDWEEYGRACVRRYSEYKKMPIFSHDELLITAALHDSSIKTAKWLTHAMDILVNQELQCRERSRELIPNIEESAISEDLPSDEYYQCCVCKTYVYLSQITCHCTPNAVCPSHASELCDCELSTRILRLRYTDQELIDLATKISDRAKIPEVWITKFNAVMAEYVRPPLRILRSLVSEAERISYPLPELPTLKAFVERANEWVEEATSFVARKHQNRRKNERVWRSGSRVQELEERDRHQRNPLYVYKLIDQAEDLGFEAPEIDLLREKAATIEEFSGRAKKALDEGTLNTLEEYTELIDEGKGLNVDLPELDTLERIVDQLKWVEKATDITDVYLSLNEVTELIKEGQRCGVSPDHELMRQLAARQIKGLGWENMAQKLLNFEAVPIQALESLVDQARDVSVHKETYDRLESVIIRTREASQQVSNIMHKVTTGIDQQPLLAEARKVLKLVDELPFKLVDSQAFRKLVTRAEEWIKRGKRLFGKSNASVQQLMDHLLYILARNESVFNLEDVPKAEGSSSPTAENANSTDMKESEDGPYCICRSGPTGEMVQCDKCKEWYHMKCLKISKKKFDRNEGWDCPICDWRKEIVRSSMRPTLAELKEWVQAAEGLSFLPEELSTVRKNIALADAWIVSIQPIVQSGDLQSISICRFYLRKIEGAEIFLPNEYNFFRRAAHALAPITSTPPPLIAESRPTKKPRPRKPRLEDMPGGQLPSADQRIESKPLSMDLSPIVSHRLPGPFPLKTYPSKSLPPKGTFPPPSSHLLPSRQDDNLPTVERNVSTCATCSGPFYSGTHNEPLSCSQCQRLHHTFCIGNHGGRLYPSFVCGDCVKLHPNAFHTLPPSPPKRFGLNVQPRPLVSLSYMQPEVDKGNKPSTVIDLTPDRSPSPSRAPVTVPAAESSA